jgi:2-polyprenyl-3-methyl-5-hydroxy-6-metoxy-1,4-benzoquinol methylase
MDSRYKRLQASRFLGENLAARDRLKKAYRMMEPFLKPTLPLLDIGSRDGWLLEYLKRKKFKYVQGIEITEEAVKYAQSKDRNVVWGDAHDLSAFGVGQYGAVLMIHSLEHCYDPKKVINQVHKTLQIKGIFYIEVPLEKKAHTDMGHFCNFTDIKDVMNLLGNRFVLLKHKLYTMGKVKHLMCVFRRI